MKRHSTVFILFMIVLLVSLACSLPGAASIATKPAVSNTDSPAATAVSPAAVPSGPLDLVQLYQARLKAGDWTEGQGLEQLLGMYTDPTQSTDPVGSFTLKDEELTGLMRLAYQYLSANPNDKYHDEVQKRVNLLVAPLDKLEKFSKKHGLSSAFHLANLKISPRPDDEACLNLWRSGFNSTTPIICFEYDDQSVDGTTVRLYYPSTWAAGDPRLARLEPFQQAAARAIHTFNAYGPNPLAPVTMVITELAGYSPGTTRRDDNLYAMAIRGTTPSPSCYVGLFPSIFTLTAEQSQQAVAHELFHCYQYKNLSNQERNPNPSATQWWVEGSADYFSNVVYPSANFEYRHMDELVNHIRLDNLFAWNYKASIFFQYLENRPDIGVPGILNLLSSLPTAAGGDVSQQAAALARYRNMDTIFQEFGQALADGNVIDSDGSPVPVPLTLTSDDIVEVSPGNILGEAPFKVATYRVIFPRNFDYNLTVTTRNPPGQSNARLENSPRTWTTLPPQVHAGCGDMRYLLVVTEVNPNLAPESGFEYDLRATSAGAATGQCSCLTGSWLLDDSTYLTHLNGIIAQAAPGTVDYTGVSGGDVVTFTQDGHLSQAINQLVVDARMHVSGLADQALRVSMDGTSSAGFTAVEGILTYTGYESNLTILTELNGSPLSAPSGDFSSGPLGSGASFVCSENTLTLTPKYPTYSNLPPLTFTRQP